MVMAFSAATLSAQVPQLLNYQGRVRVSGADFSGTGQFKFALVSGAGTTSFWSNDGTSTGGSQPAAAVSLPVAGGLYNVLLGDATVPNMTGLTPGVFSNNEVRLRVWFSDGANGWQQLTPDQRVAAVGYALMAEDLKDGAVTSAKLAAGAVTAAKLAPGAVTSAALSPTAVKDSLAAAGLGTVPSGAALISPVANAPSLLAAGYVSAGVLSNGDSWAGIAGGTARDRGTSVWTGTEMLIWGDAAEGWRYRPATNSWTQMNIVGQPVTREYAVSVWTGTEMLVWGGSNAGGYQASGGRYNPTTDTWTTMAPAGAPSARRAGPAVWTGSAMIVWGGFNGTANLADGASYNPSVGGAGTWTALPATGAPSARQFHTAVWTGTEMIVYGGQNGAALNDGGRFAPAGGGTWAALAAGPSPRFSHTAVWTGSSMLVWGGSELGGVTPAVLGNGSAYNAATQTWSAISSAGAPVARYFHGAVWTGQEMILWGGNTTNTAFNYTATGSRYNPVSGSWTGMTTTTVPAGRILPLMAWTGSELIVWGGSSGSALQDGGRYRAGQTFYIYQRP
jgi:hypothetical protein